MDRDSRIVVMTTKVIVIVVVVAVCISLSGVSADNRRLIADDKMDDVTLKGKFSNPTPKLKEKDLQGIAKNATNGRDPERNETSTQKRRSSSVDSETDPANYGRTKGSKKREMKGTLDFDIRTQETKTTEKLKSKEKKKESGNNNRRKSAYMHKGGRKNDHKGRMKSLSSSFVDSPQSDSLFGGSNTTSLSGYRKERPSSANGGKSNEAPKDLRGSSKVSMKNCQEVQCARGGQCIEDQNLSRARCLCQLGTKGQFCEKDVVVKYPKFFGTGHMAFPELRGAFKEFTVDIEFRPDDENGLLLFSSDHPEARFDFFSVSLINGHIEFRFDCGTGMGLVRTKNVVELGKWNNLKIFRHDWNGYVKLNDGPETKGKSKGVFTKMTFRKHLFLGGYQNMTSIEGRTGVATGFNGCVRFLRINQKTYDMRKGAFVGDALYGVDVDECNGHACDKVKCLNGGSCASFGADSSLCLCPLGSIGDRCQTKNDVEIPSFDGHSYLQYIGLRRTVMSYSEIEVVFKVTDPDGLLLYNGYSTDGTGDFISLTLQNGTIEYRYDLGTGPAVIRSRQPISLDTWHTVRASRNGRNGQLQLDGQQQVEGSSNGAFTQLTLTLDLFIGGHRNFDEVAKAAGISKSLKGCVQKVTINEKPLKLLDEALTGVNVADCPHSCTAQPCLNGGYCIPLKDQYQCDCPLGFENTNCQDRTARYRYRYRYRRDSTQTISIPGFAGDGFLLYTEPEIVQRTRGNRISVQFRLKATQADGVIFYVGEAGTEEWGDFLAIGLVDGHLQLTYNLGDGETIARDNFTRLDDGLWHSVKVERFDQTGYIEVDGKELVKSISSGTLKQLNTDGMVYIGGLPDVEQRTMGRYSSGLFGCLANMTLASHLKVDLMADAGVASNIGQCG